MKERIGFIGLGAMGAGMADNLLRKGWPLTVCVHRSRTAAERLIAAGATEAVSPRDLAAACDIVILCVTGSREVEMLVKGPNGLAAVGTPLLIIDCSTSNPSSTTALAAELAALGVTLIDAPLARTPKEAAEGKLDVMVGAEPEDFKAREPVLTAFCENIFHVGPPGHGHVLKLVNNMMAMSFAASIAEAFAVAAKSGLDLNRLYDVISAGGVNCGI